MKKSMKWIWLGLLLPSAALAQRDIPLLLPEERKAVDEQSREFVDAVTPVLAEAAKSTVSIWSGRTRLAYGTVIEDGTKILTKWSEIAENQNALRAGVGGDDVRAVSVSGVYEDEDLAVLSIIGEPLTPVKWSLEEPGLGRFLLAPQPTGKLAANGVVSVLQRNLRLTDQAFLGISGDREFEGPGVKIGAVQPESGAEAGGLKAGDIILRIGERTISGFQELRNALLGTLPGSRVDVAVNRNGSEMEFEITLGKNSDQNAQLSPARLLQMEQMGARLSRVRGSFSKVVETDMEPNPDQIGGPVTNLKGEVVGITMARAGRTRAYMMPSAAVIDLLKQPAIEPSLAKVAPVAEPPMIASQVPRGGENLPRLPDARQHNDRMRRHLSDMERLMENISEELEALEAGR
jgi:serine protease Do